MRNIGFAAAVQKDDLDRIVLLYYLGFVGYEF